MSEQHTPEPWYVVDPDGIALLRNGARPIARGYWIDGSEDADTVHANLTRAAVCVNACAGIPTEELEQTKWADEMSDYQMVRRHCSIIYDEASGGRISKPNTLPSEVISIMHDQERERIDEAVKEATDELDAELTAVRAQRDEAIEALRAMKKSARELRDGSDVGVNPRWLIDRCDEALAKLTEEVRA